jgi:hypothetical protein
MLSEVALCLLASSSGLPRIRLAWMRCQLIESPQPSYQIRQARLSFAGKMAYMAGH